MATLDITDDRVEVRFTKAERVLGLCRDFSFPRDAVGSVEVVDDGVDATRGIRAPGLGIPRVRYAGTWRHRGGKDLVRAARPARAADRAARSALRRRRGRPRRCRSDEAAIERG